MVLTKISNEDFPENKQEWLDINVGEFSLNWFRNLIKTGVGRQIGSSKMPNQKMGKVLSNRIPLWTIYIFHVSRKYELYYPCIFNQ